MSNADALISCYQDATLQRYFMLPRKNDQARTTVGWRLFYAVDSNVVGFFLEPHRHAVQRAGLRFGLGDVFRLDLRENQNEVAILVADYPFLSLELGVPLIAVDPINLEIKAIYENQSHSFFAAHEKALSETELALSLDAIDFSNLTQLDRNLLEQSVKLEHPAVAAAERLFELTRTGRIISSSLITERTHSAALAGALRESHSVKDLLEFAQTKEKWLSVLASVGRDRNQRSILDASALARVERCNKRLRDAQIKERLLYVTGDSYLLEAGERVAWEENGEKSTFSAAFLRHPRAFLDEPEILKPTDREYPEESETILGWLTLLLGKIDELAPDLKPVGGHIDFPSEVLSILDQVVADDAQAADRILEEWGRFTKSVTRTGIAPRAYVERLKRMLHNPEAIEEIERLRHELEAHIEQAWTKVFYVSAAARLALEVAAHERDSSAVPDRETPHLVFQARPKLAKFLREVGRWFNSDGQFDHDVYEKLRQSVREEDDTQYGDYIAHAFVLAQQAQWRSAGILAGFASAKVSGIQEFSPQCSNCRESAYLHGYCIRLTSRSANDLDKAFDFVAQAIEIATSERAFAETHGVIYEAVSERFEIELYVLKATVALYDWHAGNTNSFDMKVAEILFEIAALAERVRLKLKTFDTQRLGDDHDPVMIMAALNSVLGRCLRTSLGLRFQIGDFGSDTCCIWGELVDHCAEHEAPSKFSVFLQRFGRLIFDETISLKRRRKELDHSQHGLPPNVLPFDRDRYITMLSKGREALAGQAS
jgi:hypothetical protein